MAEEPNPHLRASDADRERVAAALREHCAVGRLTMGELDERLGHVYGARTLGELAQVTRDLPEIDPELPVPASSRAHSRDALPAPPAPPQPPALPGDGPFSLHASLIGWASMSAILTVIWLLTGTDGTFWPGYPMAIGAVVIGTRYVREHTRQDGDRRDR